MSKKYSNKQIQRVGTSLIHDNENSLSFKESINILSDFRDEYQDSLNMVEELVYSVSIKIDDEVLVTQRLKEIPSIIKKLHKCKQMKLNRMQDIGGCRAIIVSEKKLQKIKDELLKVDCILLKDYINEPKEDGYQSIHLKNKTNDFLIEIQLRTKSQHFWATNSEGSIDYDKKIFK